MKVVNSLWIAACLFFVVTSGVQAGLISWTHDTYPVDGTVDGSSVVLGEGGGFTYRTAWNAGLAAPDVTVNGVQFLGDPTTTDVTITLTGNHTPIDAQNGGEFTGNFQTLMSTLEANSASGQQWSVQLNNLTEGELYRAQFLSYQLNGSTNFRDLEIHFGTTIGDPGTGEFSAGNPGQTIGHSWTALFEADGTTQNFLIRAQDTDRSIINGVAVFQQSVPETSSLFAWAICGGCALLLWRQRRRQYKRG